MQRPLQKARNQEPRGPPPIIPPEALSPTLHPGPGDHSSFRFIHIWAWLLGFSLSCLWSLSGMNSGGRSPVERERWSSGGTDGEALF